MHLPVLCSHIYSMGKLIFLCPPHPLSQFGTHILCHCRVSLQSHCSCSDSSPPTEGMRASVGTYTLGQGVGENSALLFFFHKRTLGCSFCLRVAPHSGRGERSQHYMCCRSVYSAACIFFWGRSGIFLLMYACVHNCACFCCIVCMQVRLP